MELLNKLIEQPDSDKKTLMLAIYKATYNEALSIVMNPDNKGVFELIANEFLQKIELIDNAIKSDNNG